MDRAWALETLRVEVVAKRMRVFKVKSLREARYKGSKGFSVRATRTTYRFQGGSNYHLNGFCNVSPSIYVDTRGCFPTSNP